jgi:hypothetical protein
LINLEIVDHNNKNLYEYLCESKYLISVNSTVIFEALTVGIKVGIINLFGYETLEDLICEKHIYCFKYNENISLKKLDNIKEIQKDYFFYIS